MKSAGSCRWLLVLGCLSAVLGASLCDESRAIVDDSGSRQHHEAIPPPPQHDEGPIVLPVSYHQRLDAPGPASEPKNIFKMASLKLQYVGTPFLIALWMFIAALAKIGFHVTPKLSLICPESCLLIVVGVIIGLLLFYAGLTDVGPLTPDVFFLYLLPPIVLEAGYFMPNRPFFDNLATILLFAVLGTVFNALSVGASLWALGLTGLYGTNLRLLDALLFGSIACAVDPIAVLAVFEEVHVEESLHILVFGESLLNDAVTVVLYHTFEAYAQAGDAVAPVEYVAGVASFAVVALGGTAVGVAWGLLSAFVSRFTHRVIVIEPLFVFVTSYLAYVSAELFHFSGILSLTFCGMTMKNYVEENVSYKSHVTLKYAMKMLASSAESIIFLFLGVSTVNDNHEWNTWFVVATLGFCTAYRVIGVIVLAAMANRFRLHRIDRVQQFVLAYGGLRGAVAFALALVVSERTVPAKNMMVTTVIALVFFTVFVQGMTIGPLVRILNVPTRNKSKMSMSERIVTRSVDHLMAAIEDIVGQKLGNYHLRDKFRYYNNKYLRPILTRDHTNAEPKIFETYSKLNVADAINQAKKNHFPRNDSSFLNIDRAELDYSPSHKDLADAQLHHILDDAMFQPGRKQHYRRSVSVGHRSTGSTRSRLQIRHLLDDRLPPRRLSASPAPSTCSVDSSDKGRGVPKLRFTDADASSSRATEISSCHEDEGIVFQVETEEPSKTLTETTLPWKRDMGTVLKQHEFPSWVTNRDYVIHGSPTNTLIGRLGNQTKRLSAPAIFAEQQQDSTTIDIESLAKDEHTRL